MDKVSLGWALLIAINSIFVIVYIITAITYFFVDTYKSFWEYVFYDSYYNNPLEAFAARGINSLVLAVTILEVFGLIVYLIYNLIT